MDERNHHSAVAGENQDRINLISKQEILDVVSVRKDIPSETIVSETRKREVCESRQLCMFFAKQFRSDSLATIGTFYGGKDHATVLHANKTISNLIDTDPNVRGFVKMVTNDICEKLNEKVMTSENAEIHICRECHSTDMEIKIWIKANNHKELSDYVAVEKDDTWCCNCKSHGTLMIIKKSELPNYPLKKVLDISEFK